MIELWIPGDPVPQPRQKFDRRSGRTYIDSDHKIHSWKERLFLFAKGKLEKPYEGPVNLTADFFVRRPKSHYGTGRNAKKLKPSAPLYPANARSGDVDNLVKAVADALTEAGIWRDDGQVCHAVIGKHYSDEPGVLVKVRPA